MARSFTILLAALAVTGLATLSDAGLVPCGIKDKTTGQVRSGSAIHLRNTCKANEVIVPPAALGDLIGAGVLVTLRAAPRCDVFGECSRRRQHGDLAAGHEEIERRPQQGQESARDRQVAGFQRQRRDAVGARLHHRSPASRAAARLA